MPDIVAGYMDKISEITGRTYKPFNYYGAPDAEYVVVSMGSLSDVAKQTVEYLQSQGEKSVPSTFTSIVRSPTNTSSTFFRNC